MNVAGSRASNDGRIYGAVFEIVDNVLKKRDYDGTEPIRLQEIRGAQKETKPVCRAFLAEIWFCGNTDRVKTYWRYLDFWKLQARSDMNRKHIHPATLKTG